MDKDRVKGTFKIAKGKVKEKVGQVTGDTKTEAEGKVQVQPVEPWPDPTPVSKKSGG